MSQKILLTGTYSSFNKGDAAMQITAAQLLQQEGYEVSISAPFPDYDKSFYESKGVTFYKSNRRNLPMASLQLGTMFDNKIGSFLIKMKKMELTAFENADLVIDLSGDMLTEDYGLHVTYSHMIPLLKAKLSKTPYIVLAQSVGPFKKSRKLVKKILEGAELITVRENLSYKYLTNEIGLSNVVETADLAFNLQPDKTQRVEDILNTIKKDKMPILGVSVSQLVESNASKRGSHNFAEEMASALDVFITKYDSKIVFFPHVTGPTEVKDDRIMSLKVQSLMKNNDKAFLIKEDLEPGEIKSLISECNWFIGCRMHANIAALSSGVPLAAISYSHKTEGIMGLFELDDYVIQSNMAKHYTINRILDIIVMNDMTLMNQIQHHNKTIKKDSYRNIELVNEILGELK